MPQDAQGRTKKLQQEVQTQRGIFAQAQGIPAAGKTFGFLLSLKPFDFLCSRKIFYSLCSRKTFFLSVAGPPLAFSPRWKPFDFLPRRGIMAEIEYPGVAQLVGRDIWENTTSRINKLNNRV